MNKILLLFGLSGALGLTYQIVWARQILLIFGNTTHSTVTVLSIFMSGLATGSLVFGYLADKQTNLLKLWGKLEILIGLSALAFLAVLPIVREIPTETLFIKFLIAFILIFPA